MRGAMATGSVRDEQAVATAFASWWNATRPDEAPVRVEHVHRPSAGYSNETLVLTCTSGHTTEPVVLRLPALVSAYPDDAMAEQAAVHAALRAAGIPAPRVRAFEPDDGWLGTPFLVMDFVAGHVPGPAPALDPWVADASPSQQTVMEDGFLGVLAGVHGVGPEPVLTDHLRVGLDAELDYWRDYVEWAADGDPARALVDALAWCRATRPKVEAAPVLLWGDARLGNVIYDDDRAVVAVLDWELASFGPPETDLAWYLALDRLTTKATGAAVPGFRARDAFVAEYERRTGRPVVDLEWHEVFALVRSIAVNDKLARLAHAAGASHPGGFGDDNPMLGYVRRRIDRFR
jgi:aminoglycoside phosphotransferase (APT) family kinase protein